MQTNDEAQDGHRVEGDRKQPRRGLSIGATAWPAAVVIGIGRPGCG